MQVSCSPRHLGFCTLVFFVLDNESGDVAQRLIEVSAEKEDLQYQLSCCQGQLESQTRKAETSEVGDVVW